MSKPRPCAGPGCTGLANAGSRSKLCFKCWMADPVHKAKRTAHTRRVLAGVERLDYASDPCHRCGRWPLAKTNRTGYCRKCSRNHVRLYPDGRRAKKKVVITEVSL